MAAPDRQATVTQTFDFQDGRGPVPAARHANPDGTRGGWVANTAIVEATARVSEDARVYGDAHVRGSARVCDYARVYGSASVFGNAFIGGSARVYGNARVYEYAIVLRDAHVHGNADVYGNAELSGHAEVSGSADLSAGSYTYADLTSDPLAVSLGDLVATNDGGEIRVGCQRHPAEVWRRDAYELADLHGIEARYIPLLLACLDALENCPGQGDHS